MIRNLVWMLLMALFVACGNKSQSSGDSGFEWVDSAQSAGVDSLGMDSLSVDSTAKDDDEKLIEVPPPPKEFEVTSSDLNEEYVDQMENYDPTAE